MADTIIDHEALDIELLEQVNGGMNLLRKSGSDKTINEAANLARKYGISIEMAQNVIKLANEQGMSTEQALKQLGF